MRTTRRLMSFLLAAATLFCCVNISFPAFAADRVSVSAKEEMRGVWVATVLNLDYPSKPSSSVPALKAEADAQLDAALNMGMNTVFLQVRPTADACYQSDIFPWSSYITGTAGKYPGFDPLEYWVEAAHDRGMELHAWINPYRISHTSPKITSVADLPAGHPAKEHPSWVVKFEEKLYFNPGIPEARALIVAGVAEIVRNYDVDGIQFDDYFYPGNIDDTATFSTYGKDFASIGDWRRNNVDLLIKEVYAAVKDIRESCVFGVSPAGIWANDTTAYGSATKGNETYHTAYADTRKWVKLGWLDYIAPQIYWEIGYSIADYEVLAKWWNDCVEGTGVNLYIGIGAYRVDPKASRAAWRTPDELIKQLNLNKTLKNVQGAVFFRLGTMRASSSVATTVRDYYANATATPPSPGKTYPLAINWPTKNITENVSSYYIMGTSDPSLPLYINGEEITNRTSVGFFSKLVPLEKGENIITARQGSNVVTRIITRAALSATPVAPPAMDKAGIVTDSVRPQKTQYLTPGQTYKLSCTAPIGAEVTVTLGGQSYKLTPGTTTKPSGGKIYTTTFSYTYTAPKLEGFGKLVNIGTPTYKMTYSGKTASLAAPAAIKEVTDKAPVYMQVTADTAWTYVSNTSDGGNTGELTRGMEDYVVCTTGDWVKLGMGLWIYGDNVRIFEGGAPKIATLDKYAYTQYGKWDYVRLSTTTKTSAKAVYNGTSIVYTVYNSTLRGGVAPSLPPDSPFASVGATENGGNVTFTFRLKSGVIIDGWYFRTLDNGTQELAIKKHPAVSLSTIGKPLTGITVMLDPGHGGSAAGALGPLGYGMPEKMLALTISEKIRQALEAKGATVLMTRTTDVYLELEERLDMSRKEKPDLFLSIHLNSMGVTTDSSEIRGVVSLYKEPNGKDFASVLYEDYAASLFRDRKGLRAQNLFVCRAYWTPSVLLEIGFINNPQEFEWLLSLSGQAGIADSVTRSVITYFS